MKKIFMLFTALCLSAMSYAQYGLEKVIVEKYYVANAADSVATDGISASPGMLPVGSVTYRIYADMLPGYKLQALYGVASHPLVLSTNTTFFNNEDRGAKFGKDVIRLADNTVMLDSWLTFNNAGATGTSSSSGRKWGVVKADDTDGSIAIGTTLQDSVASTPIPVKIKDGEVAADSANTITVIGDIDGGAVDLQAGLDSLFGATNDVTGPNVTLRSVNGSIYSFTGISGPTSSNRVLLGQFTVVGKHATFHWELNIQTVSPTGVVQRFVASNPTGNEISISSLKGTLNGCTIAPAKPGTVVPNILGNVCEGATRSYSIPPVDSLVDVYKWSFVGALDHGTSTFVDPDGTSKSKVSYSGVLAASFNIQVIAVNGCGSSAATVYAVKSGVPNNPGVISGNIKVCPSSTSTYSVPAVNGVTYEWKSQTGGLTITPTPNTPPYNVVSVTFPVGFTADSVEVKANSVSCGSSALYTKLAVAKGAVPTNPVLSVAPNITKACKGDAVYVTAASTGATSYNWSLSANTDSNFAYLYVGTSKSGTFSTTGTAAAVQLKFGSSFVGAASSITITCTAISDCGNSVASVSKTITSNAALAPTAITPDNALLSGYCGATSAGFTATTVANATSYSWSVTPSPATFPGNQTSNHALLNYGSSGTSATISVKGVNGCGASATAKTLVITGTLGAATSINGPLNPCPSTTMQYSTAVGGALSYVWTLPAGATIIGPNNVATVTISFSYSFAGGVLSVKPVNACGTTSVAKSITLTTAGCRHAGGNMSAVEFNVYPNPTSGITTAIFNSESSTTYQLNIVDLTGRVVIQKEGESVEGINTLELDLSSLSKGVYLVNIKNNDSNYLQRMIVQ